MANGQVRGCSSLVTREPQIQTTVKYHFAPARKALIKKQAKEVLVRI